MDILTHGLVGAALAHGAARRTDSRLAAGVGFLAGLAADADVLIGAAGDPLLTVEFHRHFTHALVFIPVGALLVSAVLWPFLRRRLPFARLYLFALLGYSLSGFLDTCTSYGTYLLWPFVNERIAFHIIGVLDPLFTLLLLAAVAVAWWRRSRTAAAIGLAAAGAYLLLGVVQHQRADALAQELAASRGHRIERAVVKPTLGNLMLWRSVYQSGGTYYVDAIRPGLLSASRTYPGGSIVDFMPQRDLPGLPADSILARDIGRFTVLSDGYVAIHPDRPNVLIDVRYSNLPHSVLPLWGIEMDLTRPDQRPAERFYRDLSKETRAAFVQMVLGRPP
jgi:inner membrane protein